MARPSVPGLPTLLDGIPVKTQVTGMLMAFSDPTKRQRPAPLGFSVGHPLITAGSIGARVRDATGHIYVLSNNHVLANSNDANIGDPEYQPGPFDGGGPADQIATLTDFQQITFSTAANNTIDAAIALSTTAVLDNATPSDDGYGMPSSKIYGDANGDGLFDDRNALLGLHVQKYGRTTHLTHGQITAVNATVMICYEASGFSCTKFARYVDQLVIEPGGFSGGGDSGSLIVTDDGNMNPVALLFAGSASQTIGNRIDFVLNRFGVTIDGFDAPPPGPFTDVAVTRIKAPAAAVVNATTGVTVTVKNRGNQDVTSSFDVTLQDATENVSVGTQSVAGLVVGDSAVLSFNWTPHATGPHTLVGSHTLTDDRASDNQDSLSVAVNPPITDVAVTALTAPGATSVGHTISVGVTVGNVGNQNVLGSFVVTLQDSTTGVTIGTQTVSGLPAGANATLTFTWNTTGTPLGNHTLVATQSLTDDNADNNQGSTVVLVNPKLVDIALTGMTGPPSVNQGDTAHFGVTIQNTGEVDVTADFNVVLNDATSGATIGTQTVHGLAVGVTATLDFPWNTAGATATGHTLIATQMLADGNANNNSYAIGIIVKPPKSSLIDVAITGMNAPSGVTQGNTATIGVTIQNTGQADVGTSFNVVLTDSTAGVTIGTQTVTGLTVGAIATLNFSWNTTSAALGNHTLVATHTLADTNASNNRRSVVVGVTPKPVDVALTSITGPRSVTQGDTAHFNVTVQNVGQQDVTTSFAVTLNDAGVVVASKTVNGLAIGASITLDIPWNTAGAAVTGHTIIATSMLADVNASNNSSAIGLIVKAPVVPVTDVALTGMSAPGSVTQGQTVNVSVTVGNVGNQAVGTSFVVTLQDSTAGLTIGSQTVSSLGVGSSTTLTFSWSTTNVALGGHTLVATHNLSDADATNNRRSAVVSVNATVLDVAVTSLSTPGSVIQGNTATIGVTVQNVGQQNVGTSFNVVLTDATAGVTIGTQTVTNLAVGATATLSFSWNTTGAATGSHTLTASQTLADANAANNQRSAAVTVNPKVLDLSLAGMAAPASVTQGDTVHVIATVQNVGGQDVTGSFNVVLTEAGVTIGTQTVTGLAASTSTAVDFPWNTAGVAMTGHTLTARQMLADANASNDSRSIGITVSPPSVHVGNLTGSAVNNGTTWSATVQIVAHDAKHNLLNGVLVQGNWGGSNTGQCTTGETGVVGTCAITFAPIPTSTFLVSFAVTGMTISGYVYKSAANHDPDGSSNGSTIFVRRP